MITSFIFLGILVYATNWMIQVFMRHKPETVGLDPLGSQPAENNLKLQQDLPKYEDIELHKIVPPYSPSVLCVADYPPKYEV